MKFNNCRRCGATLVKQSPYYYLCKSEHKIFHNPVPTCGVFIVDDQHNVTLSVRGIEPHKGQLDVFGGFIDPHETSEEAISRELIEELGVSPHEYTPPTYICSAIGNYTFDGEVLSLLSSFFWISLRAGVTINPADDVGSVATYPLDSIPLDKLHDDGIRTGIIKLREMFSSSV